MMKERRIRFLDGCRGLAATYVAVSHFALVQLRWNGSWAGWPWRFGQEAVMIFFLLSGYVIQWSVIRNPALSPAQFLWRRVMRLYPLIALALVVSYLAASLEAGRFVPVRFFQAAGNLLALQDFSAVKPGTLCDTYLGNGPLWSLSYECWFYVLFCFLNWRVPASHRTRWAGGLSLAGAIVVVAWPNAAAYWAGYFAIWWMGRSLALAAGENSANARRECRGALLWLFAITGIIVAGTVWRLGVLGEPLRGGTYPFLVARHFAFAALLALLIVEAGHRLAPLAHRSVAPFAGISAWSYGLYVLHVPLSTGTLGLEGRIPRYWIVALSAGLALIVSWWGEMRYQPWVRGRLERLVAARRRMASPGLSRRAAD